VADNQRIEDLRRRVQKDPASIAFAQLAEELRRAGQYQESADVCHAGLALHPGYLSARVTLGRALIELNELDTALAELTTVLKSAPENLAAIRGVAEIHHRRNDLPAALAHYRAALALAKNDPDLQRTVAELAREIEPPAPPAHEDGLSFEQMRSEFLKLAPPPPAAPRDIPEPTSDLPHSTAPASDAPAAWQVPDLQQTESPVAPPEEQATPGVLDRSADSADEAAASASSWSDAPGDAVSEAAYNAERQVVALQAFLDAIHVARAHRGA
jgi:tetratricopeptide (TPR) repeat protein